MRPRPLGAPGRCVEPRLEHPETRDDALQLRSTGSTHQRHELNPARVSRRRALGSADPVVSARVIRTTSFRLVEASAQPVRRGLGLLEEAGVICQPIVESEIDEARARYSEQDAPEIVARLLEETDRAVRRLEGCAHMYSAVGFDGDWVRRSSDTVSEVFLPAVLPGELAGESGVSQALR